MPLPKIETGGDALSHPAEIVDLAEAIHARYRALVFVGAHEAADWGWPESAQAGSICRPGAVTLAEILTEVKGKLIAPAQDARRAANCRLPLRDP